MRTINLCNDCFQCSSTGPKQSCPDFKPEKVTIRWNCSGCGNNFTTYDLYEKHSLKCNGLIKENLLCIYPGCEQKFRSLKEKNAHIRYHRQVESKKK